MLSMISRHRSACEQQRRALRAAPMIAVLLTSATLAFQAPGEQARGIDLVDLVATPGVAGYEEAVRSSIVSALPDRLRARTDSSGNLTVTIGTGSPHLLIVAPTSESGYVVSDIDDSGFVRLHRQTPAIGPLFDQFFYGRPVGIQTGGDHPVAAVSATLSVHIAGDAPGRDRSRIRGLNDLVIDLGARSRSEVEDLGVRLMDPVTLRDRVQALAGGRVAGIAAQARAAAAALTLLPQALEGNPATVTVTLAWTAEATNGYRGLRRLAHEIHPDRVVLATFATPATQSNPRGQVGELDGGPVVEATDSWLAEIAGNAGVAVQPVQGDSLVDAGAARRIWADVPLHLVAVPARYLGTPVETIARSDVSALGRLLLAAVGDTDSAALREPVVHPTLPPQPPQIEMEGALGTLEQLIETYGPSGHEQRVRAAVRNMLPAWAEPDIDAAGNLSVTFGGGSRHLEFVAHLDEVGYEVADIAADGALVLRRLGGFLEAVYEASPAYVHTRSGPVAGVFAPRRGYLEADSFNPPRDTGLRVDLGTQSRPATEALGVAVGDAVTIRKRLQALAGTRVTGRSIDDRVGSSALVLALRRLDPAAFTDRRVTFAFSTGEEVGLRGATVLARRTRPDVVFAVDTFVSSAAPLDWQRRARVPVGSGLVARVLDNNHVSPRSAVDRVVAIARRHHIPMTPGSTGGGTDAGAFIEWGAIPMPISWPARYSHSPVELIDGRDLEYLVDLVVALAREY